MRSALRPLRSVSEASMALRAFSLSSASSSMPLCSDVMLSLTSSLWISSSISAISSGRSATSMLWLSISFSIDLTVDLVSSTALRCFARTAFSFSRFAFSLFSFASATRRVLTAFSRSHSCAITASMSITGSLSKLSSFSRLSVVVPTISYNLSLSESQWTMRSSHSVIELHALKWIPSRRWRCETASFTAQAARLRWLRSNESFRDAILCDISEAATVRRSRTTRFSSRLRDSSSSLKLAASTSKTSALKTPRDIIRVDETAVSLLYFERRISTTWPSVTMRCTPRSLEMTIPSSTGRLETGTLSRLANAQSILIYSLRTVTKSIATPSIPSCFRTAPSNACGSLFMTSVIFMESFCSSFSIFDSLTRSLWFFTRNEESA
eukprot:Pompholyxophrys_punicea_v1_NODE_1_length_14747_cov_12.267901.p4 type:complete len:381 gc:universal NODE_1_length_14747_cov_12.267901:8935-7793(-)